MANDITHYGLQAFKNYITKGFARDNQYQVEIDSPFITDKKMATLLCEGVSVPSKNIMSAPNRLEHASFEVPYGISYEPISLVFYVDQDLKIRDMFRNWYDAIYNNSNEVMFYNDYVAPAINIFSLSKGIDKKSFHYLTKLINAYPKSIGDIQYRATGDGQVLTMIVQFVYERLAEDTETAILNASTVPSMNSKFGSSVAESLNKSFSPLQTTITKNATNSGNALFTEPAALISPYITDLVLNQDNKLNPLIDAKSIIRSRASSLINNTFNTNI